MAFAVHWPAIHARSFLFDDDQYLKHNPLVLNPSFGNAGRFLGEVLEPSTVKGYYQPLAMISLMLDSAMGGSPDNLRPYHLTSLVLHSANTALVCLLLIQLFGRPWLAAGAAAIFGVHPMNVESIPWVAERKTLLAAFFAFAALNYYVRYARSGSLATYSACFILFLMALMSKPTTTPLPLLMLLLDIWPLSRFSKRALIEKLPLLALAAAFSVITIISQGRTGGIAGPHEYPPSAIPLILCHNHIFYLWKLIWPTNLSAYYDAPRPFSAAQPAVAIGLFGSVAVLTLLIASLRWTRAWVVGWLFFFVAIFPTMGVIGFTPVIAADRFVYLPMIGLLIPLCYALARLTPISGGVQWRKASLATAVIVAISAYAWTTRGYLSHWRDSQTLFSHMLVQAPHAEPVHNQMGVLLQAQGKLDEAADHFRQALATAPDYAEAHHNLAALLTRQGKIAEAAEHLRLAAVDPRSTADTHHSLGYALQQQGRLNEAIEAYRRGLQLDPDDLKAMNNLGSALLDAGRANEAEEVLRRALARSPSNADAHYNLAGALQALGQLDEALLHYRETIRLSPGNAAAHNNLGNTLRAAGQIDEALTQFRDALRIQPNYPEALNNLGSALGLQNKFDEASVLLKRAVQLKPDYAEGHNNLGLVLTAQGKAAEAVSCFQKAVELKPTYAKAHANLAAAYSETGRFDQAISAAQKALELASSQNQSGLADSLRQRLDAYRRGMK